ncbi:hypothetical protein ADUPG1_003903, partial [Aduncisulcus paluster]
KRVVCHKKKSVAEQKKKIALRKKRLAKATASKRIAEMCKSLDHLCQLSLLNEASPVCDKFAISRHSLPAQSIHLKKHLHEYGKSSSFIMPSVTMVDSYASKICEQVLSCVKGVRLACADETYLRRVKGSLDKLIDALNAFAILPHPEKDLRDVVKAVVELCV